MRLPFVEHPKATELVQPASAKRCSTILTQLSWSNKSKDPLSGKGFADSTEVLPRQTPTSPVAKPDGSSSGTPVAEKHRLFRLTQENVRHPELRPSARRHP
jgi:hypothetical protein